MNTPLIDGWVPMHADYTDKRENSPLLFFCGYTILAFISVAIQLQEPMETKVYLLEVIEI